VPTIQDISSVTQKASKDPKMEYPVTLPSINSTENFKTEANTSHSQPPAKYFKKFIGRSDQARRANEMNRETRKPGVSAGALEERKRERKSATPAVLPLTDSEKQLYGNRCPSGFKKIGLLGRGGCALVWLAQRGEERVAIKQFPKQQQNPNLESGYREVDFCRKLFTPLGDPHEAFQDHPGLKGVCRMIEARDEKADLWLVYELCG